MTTPIAIGPDGHVAAAAQVHCRQFDDELVILDLEGGEYFALDAIGAVMWGRLVSGKSPIEVAIELAATYDAGQDEILGDCLRLANELLGRRLVVVRPP